MASSQSDVCPICLRGDVDVASEPVQCLACGHWIHELCAEEMMRMMNVPEMNCLPCGICKKTLEDINSEAADLLATVHVGDTDAENAAADAAAENDVLTLLSFDSNPDVTDAANDAVIAHDNAVLALLIDGNPDAATHHNAVPVEAAAGSDGNSNAAAGENAVPVGTAAESDGTLTDDNALPAAHMGMSSFPLGTYRETFWCTDCKQECGLARAKRMMSKSKCSFRCDHCNGNHSRLYRGFGKWPTMEFQGLPIEVQEQFYVDIQGRTSQDIYATATDLIQSYEDRKEQYASNGEFRPLKYWELNGYDPERIERGARPDDIKESRMAGTCYRVAVESTSKTTTYGTKRIQENKIDRQPIEQIEKKKQKVTPCNSWKTFFSKVGNTDDVSPNVAITGGASASSVNIAVATDGTEATNDTEAPYGIEATDDSSKCSSSSKRRSSSSNSSSSSTSDKKTKKRKKKEKKTKISKKKKIYATKKKKAALNAKLAQKKAREQELKQTKEAAIAAKQTAKDCMAAEKQACVYAKGATLVLEKTDAVSGSIMVTEASPFFTRLPPMITSGFVTCSNNVKIIRDAATDFQQGKVNVFNVNVKEVDKAVKAAHKADDMINAIMKKCAV